MSDKKKDVVMKEERAKMEKEMAAKKIEINQKYSNLCAEFGELMLKKEAILEHEARLRNGLIAIVSEMKELG